MLAELIFAVAQLLARLAHDHAADEHPRLIYDALARQKLGDIARPIAFRDVDGLVFRERPARLEALLADHQRDADHDGDQNCRSEDRIADNDEWIAGSPRTARRR